ncbi:MAG TPA: NADP-dependent malic enzyme [Chitinophagales bacterium]|jgi:malate dehydrogenase (oxaloacetate-decarboxylating)|nr:NADP-dependent malic enzyme [Chitinophagales bacterium]MBP6153303.1 NADP-dependent malic enzyme [Chitinophagales bacterium]HQV78437.1 NADP-dependent malic enzyme [Chitinophagales bacterium]HQW78877.1 NADP-dependent malic enzyme [Chitinophagales bacterium]HRB67307.1 NADP-dependent malic enzyme [Chitinophagales bacterium]
MKDYSAESLELHEKLKGKISISLKTELETKNDLTLCYSPGVAEPVRQIANDIEKVWDLTIKGNMVAVVSDGSAILGLGNLGPEAAIPVMEGKAMLFKKFADVDAFPICLNTQNTEEIIQTIRNIAPVFGGINLEDISSPRCFEIEERLQTLGIPVFHDDQHGTAIVVLAGIVNACKLLNKKIEELNVVINGAGAAGLAITKLLICNDVDKDVCTPVNQIIMCDSKGIIHRDRSDLNDFKREILKYTNPNNTKGTLKTALKNADVFIGVSQANQLTTEDVMTMNPQPIIFPLANPIPEISPEAAYKGGAGVVGTGRSDIPNQINNVLAFPGIFKGALEIRARRITPRMKVAAAYAIADCVQELSRDHIIPSTLDLNVAKNVAQAVKDAYVEDMKRLETPKHAL